MVDMERPASSVAPNSTKLAFSGESAALVQSAEGSNENCRGLQSTACVLPGTGGQALTGKRSSSNIVLPDRRLTQMAAQKMAQVVAGYSVPAEDQVGIHVHVQGNTHID